VEIYYYTQCVMPEIMQGAMPKSMLMNSLINYSIAFKRDWGHSDGKIIRHHKENEQKYALEHPDENYVAVTSNLEEKFFKSYIEMHKFIFPEIFEAVIKGELSVKKWVAGQRPIGKKILHERYKKLEQMKLPLESRV